MRKLSYSIEKRQPTSSVSGEGGQSPADTVHNHPARAHFLGHPGLPAGQGQPLAPPHVHVSHPYPLEAERGLTGPGKGHRLLENVAFEVQGELNGEGALPQPPKQVGHPGCQLHPHEGNIPMR
jgi:hypothetical protein